MPISKISTRTSILLFCILLLTACGNKTSTADEYLWNITFNGNQYDIGTSVEDLARNVIKDGGNIVDYQSLRLYSVNGDYLDFSSNNVFEMIRNQEIKEDEILYCTVDNMEKQQVFALLFTDGDNLSGFASAEGINDKSTPDEIPGYYMDLGKYHLSGGKVTDSSYYTLVVDGKGYDISPYIEKLPDELSDVYMQQISGMLQDKPRSVYQLFPSYFQMPLPELDVFKENYADDECFRNLFAVIIALDDVYQMYKNGEIGGFGMISYSFSDGDLDSCKYQIVRSAESLSD